MLLDSFLQSTDDGIFFFFTLEKEIPRIDIRRYMLKTEFFTEFFQFFHVDFFVSADIDTSEECDIFHNLIIVNILSITTYEFQKTHSSPRCRPWSPRWYEWGDTGWWEKRWRMECSHTTRSQWMDLLDDYCEKSRNETRAYRAALRRPKSVKKTTVLLAWMSTSSWKREEVVSVIVD